MKTISFPSDIAIAAALHLDILQEFTELVQRRLSNAATPFVRDSLAELLAELNEQRDGYRLLAAAALPLAEAA